MPPASQDIFANHEPERLPASVEAEIERILQREINPELSLEGLNIG